MLNINDPIHTKYVYVRVSANKRTHVRIHARTFCANCITIMIFLRGQ